MSKKTDYKKLLGLSTTLPQGLGGGFFSNFMGGHGHDHSHAHGAGCGCGPADDTDDDVATVSEGESEN